MKSKWIIVLILIANVTCSLIIYIKNNTINKVKQRITGLYHEKNIIIDSVYILKNDENDHYLKKLSSYYGILKALSHKISKGIEPEQEIINELYITFVSPEIQKVCELSPRLCLDRLQVSVGHAYIDRGHDIGLYLTRYKGIKVKKKDPYLIDDFNPYEAILSIDGKNYQFLQKSIWNNPLCG